MAARHTFDFHSRNILLATTLLALLAVNATSSGQTIGHWRFEGDATGDGNNQRMEGNYLDDSGPNDLDLFFTGTKPPAEDITNAGAGANFPNPIPQTGQTNIQASNFGTTQNGHFFNSNGAAFQVNDFTIEAFVNRAASDNVITYIASQWDLSASDRSWALGLGSNDGDAGSSNGELLFLLSESGAATSVILSGLPGLDVGDDYYVAASFDESDPAAGVSFFLQNLTDNGPLLTASLPHTITDLHQSSSNFNLGTYDDDGARRILGLVDEVRLSGAALTQNQLLISQQQVPEPSSLLMFVLLGAVAIGVFFHQRRKSMRSV